MYFFFQDVDKLPVKARLFVHFLMSKNFRWSSSNLLMWLSSVLIVSDCSGFCVCACADYICIQIESKNVANAGLHN